MQAIEKDYEELERLGAKLHIAVPTAKWGFKLESPDGEVIYDTTERAHSWVRNAYNMLACTMGAVASTGTAAFGDGQLNIKTSAGSISGNTSYGIAMTTPSYGPMPEHTGDSFPGYMGDATVNTKGIILGTGNAVYSFEDYKLATVIENGASAGKLAYSASTVSKSWDSVNKKYNIVHSRIFNNNSASDVVVSEGGIYGVIQTNNINVAMFCRDVYATPYTIPASYKLTVNYTMSVQFPG